MLADKDLDSGGDISGEWILEVCSREVSGVCLAVLAMQFRQWTYRKMLSCCLTPRAGTATVSGCPVNHLGRLAVFRCYV